MKLLKKLFVNLHSQCPTIIKQNYLDYNCPIKFYAFHGHDIKNVDYVKQIIIKMKELKSLIKV